ncbi:putative O-antigen polymerase [Hyphomonas neptunium ATCC 15444]|uniref:Putative O-antigen polymerase n=2 Tax=Hyphomonas TaxID=85 RepID=Q0C2X9_HYPNA|nr:putative O-antigen polymerase [Hyphomonas neptunium ATCC 15444]
MFIIYLPLDMFSPLRYLCILGFVALIVHDNQKLLPLMAKSWPLFALPIFGLWSVGWSNYPSEALRAGILLLLTPIVSLVIAGRLTPQQFLRTVMFAGMIATVCSVPYMAFFNFGGLYGSKNLFAIQMLFCFILCLIAVLNQDESPFIRILALPFVPVCFYFQYLGESATTLVFAIVGGAALIGIKLFWMPVTKVKSLPTLTLLLLVAALLAASLIILNMPDNQFMAKFLSLVGKDATLTGRTELWDGARMVSDEHPWLGVGLEGFWQADTGLAQTLNENNFKPIGTKLGFHNSFWDVRVHLGLIGLLLFIWFIMWTSIRMVHLWFVDGSLLNSALLIILAVNLTMGFTESYLWGTFTTSLAIQTLAGIAPFRLHDPKLVGRAKIREKIA